MKESNNKLKKRKKDTGFGGPEFDPTQKEFDYRGKKIRILSLKQAEKENLREIAFIPGMSMGHTSWRFNVHFQEDFNNFCAITILEYNKDKLGQEGAVKTIYWAKEGTISERDKRISEQTNQDQAEELKEIVLKVNKTLESERKNTKRKTSKRS